MPFTFAHPAIVLPLKYLPNRWTSLTALVIGSMTPDFEYFLRLRIKSIYSHTWLGLFWFDLPLGIFLFFIYQGLVKDRLIEHLPRFLNRRLIAFKQINIYNFQYIGIISLSILIGAGSHLLWDAFTHPTGYFVVTIPGLLEKVIFLGDQFYLYKILQHSSTVIGIIVILSTIMLLPKGKQTKADDTGPFWLCVISVMLVTIAVRLVCGLNYHLYGNLIATIIGGIMLGVILASLITQLMKYKSY
jgi:hypothetical protein